MDHDAVLLTQSGVEKLTKEKEHLINVESPKVIEELQLARSQGDLSENADYDAAREKQAHLESRIKEIDYMLQNAEIISEDQMDLKVVKPGTTVTILDLSEKDAEPESYQIVGFTETDPLNGKISNESPLAKAVLGHGVNEIVTVGVADPYDVRIINIEFKNCYFEECQLQDISFDNFIIKDGRCYGIDYDSVEEGMQYTDIAGVIAYAVTNCAGSIYSAFPFIKRILTNFRYQMIDVINEVRICLNSSKKIINIDSVLNDLLLIDDKKNEKFLQK